MSILNLVRRCMGGGRNKEQKLIGVYSLGPSGSAAWTLQLIKQSRLFSSNQGWSGRIALTFFSEPSPGVWGRTDEAVKDAVVTNCRKVIAATTGRAMLMDRTGSSMTPFDLASALPDIDALGRKIDCSADPLGCRLLIMTTENGARRHAAFFIDGLKEVLSINHETVIVPWDTSSDQCSAANAVEAGAGCLIGNNFKQLRVLVLAIGQPTILANSPRATELVARMLVYQQFLEDPSNPTRLLAIAI